MIVININCIVLLTKNMNIIFYAFNFKITLAYLSVNKLIIYQIIHIKLIINL